MLNRNKLMKNKLLSYIFNKNDFLVRYLYCRKNINRILFKLFFWKMYTSDFNKLDNNFEQIKKRLSKNGFDFENKVCLEIGPGNSYINAYNMLMNGAEKVILVDKYPRYIKTKKQRDFVVDELNYIKKKYKKSDLFFISNGKIDRKYIEFIPRELSEIQLNKEIDFVLSIDVFEHVVNVKENIAALSRVIKSGGYAFHRIDLRDHYDFSNPSLFYKYENSTWGKKLTCVGTSYTNRIRYKDFIDLFLNNNFNVVFEEKKRMEVNKNIKIVDEFKDRSDLDVGVLNILLRKK